MNENKRHLTRRDFIRGTVGTTLAASVVGIPLADAATNNAEKSLVAVVRDENLMDSRFRVNKAILKSLVDETVLRISGKSQVKAAWRSFFKPNDIVGLVPTPFMNPTHPELVEVVKNSLVREAGITEQNIVMAQGGKRRPGRCTALISIPALKGHWLAGIGTVIKNYIMYSGRPTRYHYANSAKLGEIWLIEEVKDKTRLVLVDAIHPLCDTGPQVDPRYKWAYNGLVASKDPVAAETVCLKVLTEKRREIRGEPWPISPPPICVEAADRVYGLGKSNWEEIKVVHSGWKKDRLL